MTEKGSHAFLSGCVVDRCVQKAFSSNYDHLSFDDIFNEELRKTNSEALFIDIDPKKVVGIDTFKNRCFGVAEEIIEMFSDRYSEIYNANTELSGELSHAYPDMIGKRKIDGKVELLDLKCSKIKKTFKSIAMYIPQLQVNREIWDKENPNNMIGALSILNAVIHPGFARDKVMAEKGYLLLPVMEVDLGESIFWNSWVLNQSDHMNDIVQNGPKSWQGLYTGACGYCQYRNTCIHAKGTHWSNEDDIKYQENLSMIESLKK